MPGQIPDPSVTAGSLPSLGPLAGISATTLTDKLRFGNLHDIGTMLSPLLFLDTLGKRPVVIKTERDEEEERRKRRREKNKVAAARCRNKKKERTDYLQKESERLEMLNSDLKAQIEELKLERQQLILMLNRHRPTCIVRTDSVKTPENEAIPCCSRSRPSEQTGTFNRFTTVEKQPTGSTSVWAPALKRRAMQHKEHIQGDGFSSSNLSSFLFSSHDFCISYVCVTQN